jgi:UDP-N-acetylmuramate--alanine ligase
MIATILGAAGAEFSDPSFAIGGSIKTPHGTVAGGHVGAGEWMVAEADESDGSFEKYRPAIAVITNAEGDHLDHYKTVEKYRSAFVEFARHAQQAVVMCADDEGAREVFSASSDEVASRTVLYSTQAQASVESSLIGGFRGASFVQILQAQEIPALPDDEEGDETGSGSGSGSIESSVEESFSVLLPGVLGGQKVPAAAPRRVGLRIPGIHNARNATAALCASAVAGVEVTAAIAGVGSFLGAARRFDFQGEQGGVRLYNDYAHHPTEVSVLLDAMRRRFPGRTLRVLFQPHTYSRTKIYTRELVEALKKADDVVLSHLFAAREEPSEYPGISSQTLIDEANKEGVGDRFCLVDDMFEAGRLLAHRSKRGDVMVTVGGGDINRADAVILEALATRG